ncbi:MAG: hypothetical protein LBN02_07160 [Oscillospiraceae bacterium]|jgi:stage III sporulation protein AG|nr:hypothetical protein [Oscillospiraceae bacterium]
MTKLREYISGVVKRGGWRVAVAVGLLFGIVLLLLPSGGGSNSAQSDAVTPTPVPAVSIADTETRFANALAQIAGAGRVTVVLTLKSDGYTELATDREYTERNTSNGTDKTQSADTVTVNAGSSQQTPIIVRRNYPEFQGALVVADGADDPTVKLELTRAIAALTGLGTDRVTVTKMRNNP